jgi:toxin ParE1/3/4
MRLVYSEEAVADLVRLRAFIAEKDPAAASRVAEELVTRVENLCLFPHIGVEVPQAPQRGVIRDMVFGNYIVRYAAQPESVVVLRLWHHLEHRETSG